MPVEVRGTRLRYRIRKPVKGAKFRVHDVGKKGHTQRIAMKPKSKRWRTQAWTFPVKDIKKKRPATVKILKKLGIKTRAMKKVKRG